MTTVTTSMVKALRDKTGAGMMDCKTALTESGGDMETAVDWLRKKGLSKAAKKADRIAAEGLIGVTTEGTSGAAVEVNSETDFVARNNQFQEMVRAITALAPRADGDGDRPRRDAHQLHRGSADPPHLPIGAAGCGRHRRARRGDVLRHPGRARVRP